MPDSNLTTIEQTPPAQEQTKALAPITPMQMLQIAVEKNADLDQLQKLMDLQERWEANEARKAYAVAFAAFKAAAPTVAKNKNVTYGEGKNQTSYNHASLDNVVETLAPFLSAQGLSHSYKAEQLDGGAIRITCVLTHVLGHSESFALQSGPDQSGGKNNIQAIASTTSYLERYTFLGVTGTATGDIDDDGAHADHDPISDEQKASIIEKMKATNTDVVRFLKVLAVPTLDDLPATEFDKAVRLLHKKAQRQKESAK